MGALALNCVNMPAIDTTSTGGEKTAAKKGRKKNTAKNDDGGAYCVQQDRPIIVRFCSDRLRDQAKKKGRVADTWTFNGKIVIKDKRNNICEIASADDLVRFQ